MVSSEVSALTKAFTSKTTVRQIILPMGPPDVVGTENLEFDFSDVFGTTPVQSLTSPTAAELTEEVYDDPVVIFKRSHSLVGPTALISTQSPRFSFLNLHETKNSLDLLESLSEEGAREQEKVDETCEKSGVGLDDFEILKLVGQGAFGKVFQVKKKGSNEIYAMKVVRKDKILEKNHVEYMKAERDILTKTDHPFIVQLRYSFQVLSPVQRVSFSCTYYGALCKMYSFLFVKLSHVMQTKYRLYLVLDFINGGHLFFQLYHQGLFRLEYNYIFCHIHVFRFCRCVK